MIDTSGNKKELKSLIQQKKDVAAFIGAGCSKVLNIPIWDDLLFELNKEFEYYTSREKLLEAIRKDDYPTVASNIESKATDKKQYTEIIKKFTKPRSCYFTSLHLELIQLTNTIITTNYDKSFEETFESLKRVNGSALEYHSFSIGQLLHKGLGINKHIYHIHGDNDDGNFILTYESYKDQYDSHASGVASIIRAVFSEFNVVFVGFSFKDTFFVSFLEDTLKRVSQELDKYGKGKLPTHYCIMPDTLYKNYFNAKELTDQAINITDMLKKGVLIEKKISTLNEPVFYFENAIELKIPTMNGIDDETKKYLIEQIEYFKSNDTKIKLFDELGIKPITFNGDNFLEIESILREINAPFNPVANSYAPN